MASITELERTVAKLKKQLEVEEQETEDLEREVRQLNEELRVLKTKLQDKERHTSNGVVANGEAAGSGSSIDKIPLPFEGWLEKKGAVRHNWKRRYFVIEDKNNYLNYYANQGVSTDSQNAKLFYVTQPSHFGCRMLSHWDQFH
jgi:hypothetical protein